MRKILFVISFFVLAHGLLAINLLYYLNLTKTHDKATALKMMTTAQNNIIFAALPAADTILSAQIEQRDGRVESVRTFLNSYSSALAQHAEVIVQMADKYHIDYKLIPAIAMQESTGCKIIPINSYNCWGFGIYGTNVKRFSSYPEAIDVISQAISKHYVDRGLDTPASIMPIWAPPSNGSWAKGVAYFMQQMQ